MFSFCHRFTGKSTPTKEEPGNVETEYVLETAPLDGFV